MELPYELFVNLSFDELANMLIAPNPKAELKKRLDEQKQKQIKNRQQQIIKEQQQGQGQQTKQEQTQEQTKQEQLGPKMNACEGVP